MKSGVRSIAVILAAAAMAFVLAACASITSNATVVLNGQTSSGKDGVSVELTGKSHGHEESTVTFAAGDKAVVSYDLAAGEVAFKISNGTQTVLDESHGGKGSYEVAIPEAGEWDVSIAFDEDVDGSASILRAGATVADPDSNADDDDDDEDEDDDF